MLDLRAIKGRLEMASPDKGRRVGYPPDADLKNHAYDDLAALMAEVEQLRAAIAMHKRSVEKMRDTTVQELLPFVRRCDRELWSVLNA